MEMESIIRQLDMFGSMTSDLCWLPDVTLPSSEERALAIEEFGIATAGSVC